jgi:membrane fusion protein (multidrug efflux system)
MQQTFGWHEDCSSHVDPMTTLTASHRSVELLDEPRPAELPDRPETVEPKTPPKKRSIAKMLLPILALLAAGAGAVTWSAGRGKESTDDAQIEGHVGSVGARVPGQVKRVLVKDNQHVRAGDVLVELDDRDYRVKVAAAKADLAAATASLHTTEAALAVTEKSSAANVVIAKGGVSQAKSLEGTTHASIAQARADVAAAESRRKLAALERDRSQKLFAEGAVSRADWDVKSASLDQADAALEQARARLASAKSGVGNSTGSVDAARGRLLLAELGPDQIDGAKAQVELAEARVEQAKAALEQAELNLSYTQVTAETSGVVARRSVEVGQSVSPDRPLMAIVPLDDTWVVANFKEDQLADMQPGQSAELTVDGYPGRTFHGQVDSIAAGTGSRFSLLPPDNASGNFTKVVQRVPVLVHLDEPADVALRPGMSVTVTVVTK